jgi:hypothetical protein
MTTHPACNISAIAAPAAMVPSSPPTSRVALPSPIVAASPSLRAYTACKHMPVEGGRAVVHAKSPVAGRRSNALTQ